MLVVVGFNAKFEHEYKSENIPHKSLKLSPSPPREFRIETSYRPATPEEKRFVQNRINTENARKELLLTFQQDGATPFDLSNF
jgi:hypothetical protein